MSNCVLVRFISISPSWKQLCADCPVTTKTANSYLPCNISLVDMLIQVPPLILSYYLKAKITLVFLKEVAQKPLFMWVFGGDLLELQTPILQLASRDFLFLHLLIGSESWSLIPRNISNSGDKYQMISIL